MAGRQILETVRDREITAASTNRPTLIFLAFFAAFARDQPAYEVRGGRLRATVTDDEGCGPYPMRPTLRATAPLREILNRLRVRLRLGLGGKAVRDTAFYGLHRRRGSASVSVSNAVQHPARSSWHNRWKTVGDIAFMAFGLCPIGFDCVGFQRSNQRVSDPILSLRIHCKGITHDPPLFLCPFIPCRCF